MRQSRLKFDAPVEPIDEVQQAEVVKRTRHFIQRASQLLDRSFDDIPVLFNLRGRTAGMYVVRNGVCCIRYNPHILAADFSMGMDITVPHEVAHYITDKVFGLATIRPHGVEWQQIMRAFGVSKPRATGRYDISLIPCKKYRQFSYQCGCRQHSLTTIRHNKVQRNKARYYCRFCGCKLVYTNQEIIS